MLNSRSFYYTLRVLPDFMLIEALSLLIPSLYESFRLGPIGLDFPFFFTKVKSLLLCKSFYFLFRRLGWFSGGVLLSVILFHFYSIEGLLLKLGIPMIVFCTANESGSEQETDAGVGAQESSGARSQGA